jgi:hypothetical protein
MIQKVAGESGVTRRNAKVKVGRSFFPFIGIGILFAPLYENVFRSLYKRELMGNAGFKFDATTLPWERELIVFFSQPNSIASN